MIRAEAGVIRRRTTARLRLLVAGLLVSLAVGARAASGQEAISADRPGLDFSPLTVSPGTIQMEIGIPVLSLEQGPAGDSWLFQTPTLARVGLVDGFELRAGLSPYNSLSTPRNGDTGPETKIGVSDLEFGAKVRLTGESGGLAVVAIPSLLLPTGTGEFTGDAVGYLLNAVVGFSLADAVWMTLTGGLYDLPDGSGRSTSGLTAIGVGRAVSSVVGVFAEAGIFPQPGPDPAQLGGGLTLLLSPDVQLDAAAGAGLTDSAPDWQFGSGIAFRF